MVRWLRGSITLRPLLLVLGVALVLGLAAFKTVGRIARHFDEARDEERSPAQRGGGQPPLTGGIRPTSSPSLSSVAFPAKV